jgi:hypothetical protein
MRVAGTGSVRRCLAALAVAASVLVPVSGRATATSPAIGWIISRNSRGPAVLDGTFTAQSAGYDAAMGTFALTGTGRGRRVDWRYATGFTSWGSDGWVRIYRPGAPAPTCPVGATCADPRAPATTVTLHSNGHPIDSVVYVVAWNVTNPSVKISSPGWRVRPWRPAMRTVTTDSANATGVSAAQTSIGSFTSAEASGGQYGSFAFASIPCNLTGRGQATFTGDGRIYPLDCATGTFRVAGTTGRTRWRITGDVIGVGWNPHVLMVIDYPRSP